jgi:hypothetical protein
MQLIDLRVRGRIGVPEIGGLENFWISEFGYEMNRPALELNLHVLFLVVFDQRSPRGAKAPPKHVGP